MRKTAATVLCMLLLTLAVGFGAIRRAQSTIDTIYIRADGTIDPPTASITTTDSITYTFTDDIVLYSIVVERNDIVIDGAGYTLQGTHEDGARGIVLNGRTNVAITNINIDNFYYGIWLSLASGNSVSASNISNSVSGIWLESSSNNDASDNTIRGNEHGVELAASSHNSVSGNTIANNNYGVGFASLSRFNSLSDNTITANNFQNIWLGASSNNSISENTVTASIIGIRFSMSSSNNSLSGNTIANNAQGIEFDYNSSHNNVSDNSIANNNYGIWSERSSNHNSVSGNSITNNLYGIWLDSSISDNKIYHNNFVGNIHQASVDPSTKHANVWDDGYPSGGNYWSDYIDTDIRWGPGQDKAGSDGIWDHPYVVNEVNRDQYPFTQRYPPPPHGPRMEDLIVYFYTTREAAYTALSTGDVDMVAGLGWSSALDLLDGALPTSAQVDNAFTNPNIIAAPISAANMYEFDLNNNYTIPDYPDWRSPMNYTEMRQAIAFLSNKDYYVGTLCGGKAVRIDQKIAAPYAGWGSTTPYPYEYSPAAAKATLDSTFPPGPTLNPNYDPLEPLSSPTLRTYPVGHTKAGQDLDPLKFMIRDDYSAQLQAGRMIVDWMRKLGVPVDSTEGTSSALCPDVMGDRNCHFYTGAHTVGRFPPLTLYQLFHSDNAFPNGSNYVTGVRPGVPTHPLLDQLLHDANYALSYGEAVEATQLAVNYWTDICVSVPLWSDLTYCLYSTRLLGVVNMQGYGPINPYTFMNAYKTDGTPIRIGLVAPPLDMNTVYSSWIYDYLLLDRITLYSDVEVPPYNLVADQSSFVKNWEITTWAGDTRTLVRQTYRSDAYFCKPATGDVTTNVNATCYFFNAWYDYQVGDGWFSTRFKDLHHIDLTGVWSSDVYFNTLSYWNAYYCRGPLRPMDTWGAQPTLVTKTYGELIINPATPGPIDLLYKPCWIEAITFDGTPLSLGTDYNIIEGHLYIYVALGAGTLSVDYWAPNNAHGDTPGNLPWQTIFEGAGMYYCTSFTPGIDGSITLKCNPHYYMDTPPLGEVDFVRKPNGACKIDIFDVVLAAGAYGSQGTGIPSSHWFPGADLAPEAGKVDIFDLVTVCGQYGREWDRDP